MNFTADEPDGGLTDGEDDDYVTDVCLVCSFNVVFNAGMYA